MSKNAKGILVLLIVAGVCYTGYTQFFPSKAKKVRFLIQNNYSGGTTAELMAFGDDYIQAWWAAAKKGDLIFSLAGKNYNTKGGKSI